MCTTREWRHSLFQYDLKSLCTAHDDIVCLNMSQQPIILQFLNIRHQNGMDMILTQNTQYVPTKVILCLQSMHPLEPRLQWVVVLMMVPLDTVQIAMRMPRRTMRQPQCVVIMDIDCVHYKNYYGTQSPKERDAFLIGDITGYPMHVAVECIFRFYIDFCI